MTPQHNRGMAAAHERALLCKHEEPHLNYPDFYYRIYGFYLINNPAYSATEKLDVVIMISSLHNSLQDLERIRSYDKA